MEKRRANGWLPLLGAALMLLLLGRPATAGFGDWLELGPDGGDLYSVGWDPSHPDIAYAGGTGGVFKSVDGGQTWTRLVNLPPVFVYDVEIDPDFPDVVFVATNQGVYRSADGGNGWSLLLEGDFDSVEICHTCGDIRATNYGGGVYLSTDGGAHWGPSNLGLGTDLYAYVVRSNPLNGKTYLGTNSGLYQWSGSAWNPSDLGIPTGGISAIAFDPADPFRFYVGTWDHGAYKTTNGGGGWSSINTGLTATWVTGLSVDKNSPSTIYAATDNGLFKSAADKTGDGGLRWSPRNTGLNYNFSYDVKINPFNSQKLLLASFGGGVYRSTNGAGSWTDSNSGISCAYTNALAIDPQHHSTIYAGTDGGLFKSLNGGLNWSFIAAAIGYDYVQSLAIDPSDTLRIYGGTTGRIFRSENGGSTWSAAVAGLVTQQPVDTLTIDPTFTARLYAGTHGDGIFGSTDFGSHWTPLNTGLTNKTVRGFAIDPSDSGKLYASTDGGIFKSGNFGSNWSLMNSGLAAPNAYAIAIDPVHPSNLLASTSAGVYKSTNGATSWSLSNNGLTGLFAYSLQYDPDNPAKAYAGTNNGVFQTTNGGALWISVGFAFDKIVPESAPARPLIGASGFIAPYVPSLAVDPVTPAKIYGGTNAGVFSTTVSGASSCTAGPTTLCLQGGRFKVTVTWHDQHSATLRTGVGTAVPDTDQTGRFWFFSSDAIELLVKIVDGRGLNGSFWIFYGALSDVEYTITVTDTVDGKVKTYHNAPGAICGGADTSYSSSASSSSVSSAGLGAVLPEGSVTFRADPVSAAENDLAETSPEAFPAPCTPTATTLCLLSSQFRVSVTWKNQHAGGATGVGNSIPSTDQTGYFWFFSSDATELAVKIVDGRGLNGKFWVFYGALSDVEYTITVTNTANGAVKTYHNAPGAICGGADTSAF